MGSKAKFNGQTLLPYMSPLAGGQPAQAATPAPVTTPAPATAGPMFNVVPRYTGRVQAVAQPMRAGQPTRRALMQIIESQTAE